MPHVHTPVIGENLRRLRAQRDISQERLGDISGVSRSTIAVLERRRRARHRLPKRDVRYSTLESLAAALGVTVPELTGEPS